jgi:hypothetical protein
MAPTTKVDFTSLVFLAFLAIIVTPFITEAKTIMDISGKLMHEISELIGKRL